MSRITAVRLLPSPQPCGRRKPPLAGVLGQIRHAGGGFPAHEGQCMPYIALNSAEPGIRGLLRYRPETGRPLSELTEVLLRGPGTLTRGERELIAAYVSALNQCRYCSASHSACAAAQLPEGMPLVEQVRADAASAPVSAKLKALLAIAAAVQE